MVADDVVVVSTSSPLPLSPPSVVSSAGAVVVDVVTTAHVMGQSCTTAWLLQSNCEQNVGSPSITVGDGVGDGVG